MKLIRLVLTGFKSFADTVELELEDGITAIVGPNGCGKSNISDAVRWVLGEQRARMLRGQRMDEVIFQGSAGRRPINLAEVSLVFDNSDGSLDVPYHEVVVTRRLSRSGQSEYLLNQASARLRDVQDLLRGTGLGSDAGVVIEARMIDRLLSDRADERRSLFEEAAGIGLYRDRKVTTERRLEKTTEDLQRLEDLIGEVQSQVRSLARQRGKAERYAKYQAERFSVVMTLTRRELEVFDRRHAALDERRRELDLRLPEAREAVVRGERAREAAVEARAAAVARASELERRLADTRLAAERLEGDLKLAEERLQNAAARRTRAEELRGQAAARADLARREREAAAAERQAAEDARRSVQTELDLRAANEDEVRGQFSAQRERVRDREDALQRHVGRQHQLTAERAALERELAHLDEQHRAAEARVADARQTEAGAHREVETARRAVGLRQAEAESAHAAADAARRELLEARKREDELRAERRHREERLAQLAARGEALRALEQRREGLAPAARALLAARERFGEGAVVGPLSDFVRVASADAERAEHLLADWLHAVLVRDDSVVQAVRLWHDDVQPGPLVLLPLDPGPSPSAAAAAALGPDAWIAALLAGSEPLDERGRAIRRPNGAVFLAGAIASGPLIRRAELDRIELEQREVEQRLRALSEALDAAVAAHREAAQALDAALERGAATRAALLETQGSADDATRRHLRAQQERHEAEHAIARLAERIAERRERARAVDAELASAIEGRGRLEEELASEQAALADLEAAQDAARERRVHWQVEEAQIAAREQSAREREERARVQEQEALAAMAALDRELEEIARQTSDLTQQHATWADQLEERRVAAQQLEAAARDATAAMAAAEQALEQAERALEAARTHRDQLIETEHRLEVERTEAEGRRQALIERVEAEWHKPIAQLVSEATPVEGDTEALRAEAERLAAELERLGPVNPLAVEEHAEEVKRLEFLEAQRDDLVQARTALAQALREIDQTARAMFLETFGAVRENFRHVFHTLFGGGECEVRLADESDPLGSDIDIIAAPRGKRTQRIHLLSSGERALVAVSLLFSIYLAKPAPFCLLDEVDAPLDDANVARFVRLLQEFKSSTQFIVITHNPRTMQVADAVYGVTMQEPGVSTIVGVRLGKVERTGT